jgi:very-short-patch-repair endonuclease
MSEAPARKTDPVPAIRAHEREKRVEARKSPLSGTVCALEPVRGTGRAEIARLGGLQHGCAHREQLLLAGAGRSAIAYRLKTQRYLRLHKSVYLIDPARADDWTPAAAAVLRFAGDALVSGRSAGAVWQLLDELPARPELTLVARSSHSVSAVKVRRAASIDPGDIAWRHGLPVTSVARTLVDLAAPLTALELESVMATALRLRLTTLPKIRGAAVRAPHAAGIATLRHLLDQGGFARTRSYYERELLGMIVRAGLPRPLINHRIRGHEVDMCWPRRRLVLEFDGFTFHSDRRAFENDRRRDQDLVAAGYRVIRVTARQVEEEPLALIARLTAALMA